MPKWPEWSSGMNIIWVIVGLLLIVVLIKYLGIF